MLPEAAPGTTKALLVRASTHLCALPIAIVVETMRPQPIRPAQGAPPFVRGVAIIRGEPVPVIDLGALLGGEGTSRGARFVTVRSGDRHVSLEVAAVVGVRTLDLSALAETPRLLGAALPEQVERLGVLDGQTLAVLNTARLLPEVAT